MQQGPACVRDLSCSQVPKGAVMWMGPVGLREVAAHQQQSGGHHSIPRATCACFILFRQSLACAAQVQASRCQTCRDVSTTRPFAITLLSLSVFLSSRRMSASAPTSILPLPLSLRKEAGLLVINGNIFSCTFGQMYFSHAMEHGTRVTYSSRFKARQTNH